MERRIASMSKLNGDVANLKLNDTRNLAPSPSTRTDPGSYAVPQKSLPNLRTPSPSSSNSSRNSQPVHPLHGPPTIDSAYLHTTQLPPTMAENGDSLLMPPPIHIPQLQPTDSPPGSRPASRDGRRLSRPGSRDASLRPGSRDASQTRDNSRPSSRPGSRAYSPSMGPPALAVDTKLVRKRRSWLPGSSTSFETPTEESPNAQAWLITPRDKIPYDLSPLLNFQPVNELWDSNGDTLVYLHNSPSGPGASFRVDSACFASSRKLVNAAHGQTRTLAHSRQASTEFQQPSFTERAQGLAPGHTLSPPHSRQLSTSDRSTSSGGRISGDFFADPVVKKDVHLCLPQALSIDPRISPSAVNPNDGEILVTVRNLFAFLIGKPLLATSFRPTIFAIFMHMSEILQRYDFTNFDESTLGEEAMSRFGQYLSDFRIADVRSSREQTIEAILLGERMKCFDLYNEGYVHAVGKYPEIAAYKTAKTAQISELSRKRLERSHMFLSTRLRNVRDRLEDFDFPALWGGIAKSTSSSESKTIRFKAWRIAFQSMRKHVLEFYKQRYGHWPPKARSKKNTFEESGLNRLLLKEVYQDLCDLYDVLADSSNLTTRHVEIPTDEDDDPNETLQRALRRVLSEYDRSIPPVQPPIPFDTPWLPSLASTRRDFEGLDPKKQKKECTKKLPDSEINTALMQSYNRDLMKSTPFLQAFFAFERRNAHNKSIEEIADHRIGQWLLMYVVIQALPLVVIDAPGVRYTDGVEYFISEFPKESPPWMAQDRRQMTTWRIPGSETMVDMPVASVEHSLDAIYQRSHCWQIAQQWAGPAAITTQYDLPQDELLPPVMPSVGHSRHNSGGASPDRRASAGASFADRRLSMGVGLEQLPLPSGVGVSPTGSRPTSVYDPNKSFNSILGLGIHEEKGGKKKK